MGADTVLRPRDATTNGLGNQTVDPPAEDAQIAALNAVAAKAGTDVVDKENVVAFEQIGKSPSKPNKRRRSSAHTLKAEILSHLTNDNNKKDDDDGDTEDSILIKKKKKSRKSMARRVSFAPESFNELCVYEKDDYESDSVRDDAKSGGKLTLGFETSNRFSALQSPSASERTNSTMQSFHTAETTDRAGVSEVQSSDKGALAKKPVAMEQDAAQPDAKDVSAGEPQQASAAAAPEQPASLEPRVDQSALAAEDDDTVVMAVESDATDSIKLHLMVQEDDTVGISLTGDLTAALPRLADLVQEDESTMGQDKLTSFDDNTENATSPLGDDVTGRLPNLSSLVQLDEEGQQQQQAATDAAASQPMASPDLDIPAVNCTMDLTENITLNLPDLAYLVNEDEGDNQAEKATPLKDESKTMAEKGSSDAVFGSSTKKALGAPAMLPPAAAAAPAPAPAAVAAHDLTQGSEEVTRTSDIFQKPRWGFEPGAVDTMELDLTHNGAKLMGDRTFHAVYRQSMSTAQMPGIHEEGGKGPADADADADMQLSFHDFLQEADIQFLDFLRRGTSFGASHLNSDSSPSSLLECLKLVYVTTPEISLLERGCATLQEDVHQRKFHLADKEQEINGTNPPIFQAIQNETGEKLVNLKFDVQQLKRCCRQQTSQAWKEWRAKLEGRGLNELVKILQVLEQDRMALKDNRQLLRDLHAESESLVHHVEGQVKGLRAQTEVIMRQEAQRAALTKEEDGVKAWCASLDASISKADEQLSGIAAERNGLASELQELEHTLATSGAAKASEGAEACAMDVDADCSSSKVELSKMVAEWDMMVGLCCGRDAIAHIQRTLTEEHAGDAHAMHHRWQSFLHSQAKARLVESEAALCMQQHVGNVVIDKPSGSQVAVTVLHPAKGCKVRFAVDAADHNMQPAVLEAAMPEGAVAQGVQSVLEGARGMAGLRLSKIVADIVAIFNQAS